mmetsp:Transcript_106696/g.340552  ORF Transcript_106696/g.340552 Transcript_106696/m.340552 type:complete len:221 (+) Transcript_106696:433-1095(+)
MLLCLGTGHLLQPILALPLPTPPSVTWPTAPVPVRSKNQMASQWQLPASPRPRLPDLVPWQVSLASPAGRARPTRAARGPSWSSDRRRRLKRRRLGTQMPNCQPAAVWQRDRLARRRMRRSRRSLLVLWTRALPRAIELASGWRRCPGVAHLHRLLVAAGPAQSQASSLPHLPRRAPLSLGWSVQSYQQPMPKLTLRRRSLHEVPGPQRVARLHRWCVDG